LLDEATQGKDGWKGNGEMIEELNKEILERLYVNEGKPAYAIAKMFGCTTMTVWARCKKYGIKTRPKGGRIIKIKKSVLQKLYVNEGKTLKGVAELLSCSPFTVVNRCRQYGIEIRGIKRVKGLEKSILQKLYVEEKKSTTEIARMYGCSHKTVEMRCREYGIKLRLKSGAIKRLNKSALQRLYVREGKSIDEIARRFSVHPYNVRMKCNQYGIEIKDHRIIKGITESLLQEMYVEEGKSTREIAKIIGCSREPVRLKCKQFGIPLRPFAKKSVEIDKPTLHRLYIEEKKTVTEVASIFNCSTPTILRKARKYDIKLRPRGGKKLDIDESTLRRLYVEEGKSMPEVAKIFNCSVSVIYQRVKEFGLGKRT